MSKVQALRGSEDVSWRWRLEKQNIFGAANENILKQSWLDPYDVHPRDRIS